MAQVYQNEGNFENAFILYIKFSTLFLEKIIKHPEYKTFDPVMKKQNRDKLKDIIPIAEKLKQKLKSQFEKEYEQAEKYRRLEREREAAFERERVSSASEIHKLTISNI